MFIFKLIVGIIYNVAIFGGLLFLPAGTLEWWRAWVFIGVVFIGTVATMISVFPGKEDMLAGHFKSPIQKGQPLADKIILLLLITTFSGLIVFIPMDVFRFHLMASPEQSFRLWGWSYLSRVGGSSPSPLRRMLSRHRW